MFLEKGLVEIAVVVHLAGEQFDLQVTVPQREKVTCKIVVKLFGVVEIGQRLGQNLIPTSNRVNDACSLFGGTSRETCLHVVVRNRGDHQKTILHLFGSVVDMVPARHLLTGSNQRRMP